MPTFYSSVSEIFTYIDGEPRKQLIAKIIDYPNLVKLMHNTEQITGPLIERIFDAAPSTTYDLPNFERKALYELAEQLQAWCEHVTAISNIAYKWSNYIENDHSLTAMCKPAFEIAHIVDRKPLFMLVSTIIQVLDFYNSVPDIFQDTVRHQKRYKMLIKNINDHPKLATLMQRAK